MSLRVDYGAEAPLIWDSPPGNGCSLLDLPQGEPLADVKHEAIRVLAQPLSFPPLHQAVIADDRVAIALGEDVPATEVVLAAIVESLAQGGVAAEQICVVHTLTPGRLEVLQAALGSELAQRLGFERHDPDHRDGVSYLAASKQGRSYYLNRTLCESELVVTLSVPRPSASFLNLGPYSQFYPTFSDAATQQRFRNPKLVERGSDLYERARHEIESVRFQAGVSFDIQVVPGSGDSVLAILAGEPAAVDRAAGEAYDRAWQATIDEPPALVVAALSGAGEQTWHHLARVVSLARQVVADDGGIVLCTSLAELPSPVWSQLDPEWRREELQTFFDHQRSADSLSVLELTHAARTNRLYLLSRLEAGVVEDLGFIPLVEADDVTRLAARQPTVLVIPAAQRVSLVGAAVR